MKLFKFGIYVTGDYTKEIDLAFLNEELYDIMEGIVPKHNTKWTELGLLSNFIEVNISTSHMSYVIIKELLCDSILVLNVTKKGVVRFEYLPFFAGNPKKHLSV